MSISKAKLNCMTPLLGGNDYYVYAHAKLNGEVFYIGHGKWDRAWRTPDKCPEWYAITEHEKWQILFKETNLTKDQALLIEKELIMEIEPSGNLVNYHFNGNRKTDKHLAKLQELRNGQAD